jgi:hypothetical protein
MGNILAIDFYPWVQGSIILRAVQLLGNPTLLFNANHRQEKQKLKVLWLSHYSAQRRS